MKIWMNLVLVNKRLYNDLHSLDKIEYIGNFDENRIQATVSVVN